MKSIAKIIIPCFVLLIIALIFPSFQRGGDLKNSPEVKEALAAKIDEYRKTMMNNCKGKAIQRAEAMVDSILEVNARKQRIQSDTITRPPIPEKPTRPEDIVPDDSSPVAPLLEGK